jgi:hypothetical protein
MTQLSLGRQLADAAEMRQLATIHRRESENQGQDNDRPGQVMS